MNQKIRLFLLIAVVMTMTLLCPATSAPTNSPRGNLVIIGGGKRPVAVMKKFVELAGGTAARIAIIPMASELYAEAGKDYETEFRGLGVAKAKAFYIHNAAEANDPRTLAELATYTGYFFGGGDQNRLTAIFLKTRALELFHRRYREGATLSGTSAGAAVMSRIMITGDGDWQVMKAGSVQVAEGFGFVAGAVIDQHFVKRQRLNRLLAVCIEKGTPGIGIDESTALWVRPNGPAEVLGHSVIIVLNPDHARLSDSPSGKLLEARDISISVLRPGDHLDPAVLN